MVIDFIYSCLSFHFFFLFFFVLILNLLKVCSLAEEVVDEEGIAREMFG